MQDLLSAFGPTPIFNLEGDDTIASRTMWYGSTTNLMQLNDVRYNWAIALYSQMRSQFWIPSKLDLTEDVTSYKNLTPDEKRAFDGILSYLTFLDSVQTCNIPHLKLPITAPEISLCMAEQISQEAMHSHSYQYIIETIVPSGERAALYDFWRSDEILRDRCAVVARSYQDYVEKRDPESYFVALMSDYLLEGLYFYNGFAFFYALASRMLMSGCADIFKLINRDELSHVRLYQKMIPEAMTVFPHSTDMIYEMFDRAVESECRWTNHIMNNAILGISEESTECYTRYLANVRLRAIGLEPLYPDARYTKNPYAHLDRLADIGEKAETKSNFFESTVTSYVMSSGVSGWNEW